MNVTNKLMAVGGRGAREGEIGTGRLCKCERARKRRYSVTQARRTSRSALTKLHVKRRF